MNLLFHVLKDAQVRASETAGRPSRPAPHRKCPEYATGGCSISDSGAPSRRATIASWQTVTYMFATLLCAFLAFPKVRLSASARVTCGCLEPATSDAERSVPCCGTDNRTRDEGLSGLRLQKFCTSAQAFDCNVTQAPRRSDQHDLWSTSGSVDGIDTDHDGDAVTAARSPPQVAWVLTGGLRSFFAPMVHKSIYQNAIRAVGGRPRLFMIASLADDAKSDREAVSVGSSTVQRMAGINCTLQASAQHCSQPGCAAAYANLSGFLAAQPRWGAMTAHVEEELTSRPTSGEAATLAAYNPRCHLPEELDNAFRPPHYLAQMARWHAAIVAVRRYERQARRQFDFVAKLRFDVAVPSPLSPRLLRSDRAFLGFPPAVKIFRRMVPVRPRARAARTRARLLYALPLPFCTLPFALLF